MVDDVKMNQRNTNKMKKANYVNDNKLHVGHINVIVTDVNLSKTSKMPNKIIPMVTK